MTWTSAFTPEIWPMTAALFLMLLLAAYSWRRRSVPGALPFMASCLFAALITTGLLMAHLAVEPESRSFWLRFMLAWILPAATAVTCFVLEYAWPGRWLTRRNLILVSILPLFSVFYFLWGEDAFLGTIDFAAEDTILLPLNLFSQVFIVYALISTVINLVVFAWLFVRSPQHRWPVMLMAASQISLRLIIFGEIPSMTVQVINLPAFVIPYVAYAIALFGFRIFDPIPLARQMAIDQLYAGMIVLDPQGRVVSLNPAAERILGTTSKEATGCLIREWLPINLEESRSGVDEAEFSQGSGPEQRYYMQTFSRLADFRGLPVGSLLMLRDITEQKQAQAQILERQRALATQNERERMARELHDSLGQVLGYASLQAQTAASLSRTGQGEAAGEQLDRLDNVVREAHADLREYILNLRSTTSLQQPFFVTIKQYLDSFTTNYDIQTLLNVSPDLSGAIFAPEMELHLFRIFQEALSNARKHGRARLTQVSFTRKNRCIHMVIEDDGCGFNVEDMLRQGATHYGLQFMRERAAQLEGSLEVHSVPGKGTRVELVIPWKEG